MSETATLEAKMHKIHGLSRAAKLSRFHAKSPSSQPIRRNLAGGSSFRDLRSNSKTRNNKARLPKLPTHEAAKRSIRSAYRLRLSQNLGRPRANVIWRGHMPANGCDIHFIIIGKRAFAIGRQPRPGDFRASGSGQITYQREDIDERCVKLAFETADKLGGDCVALDFVFDADRKPWILEVSYGFVQQVYDDCTGYWVRDMAWHPGPFNPQGWMVEQIISAVQNR